jgi:Flp pilus assembly pilin Flp
MLFAPKEKGQGLVEYALILVLVAVVVIQRIQQHRYEHLIIQQP